MTSFVKKLGLTSKSPKTNKTFLDDPFKTNTSEILCGKITKKKKKNFLIFKNGFQMNVQNFMLQNSVQYVKQINVMIVELFYIQYQEECIT